MAESALKFLDYPRFYLFAERHSLLNKIMEKMKLGRKKVVMTARKEDGKEHSNKCKRHPEQNFITDNVHDTSQQCQD